MSIREVNNTPSGSGALSEIKPSGSNSGKHRSERTNHTSPFHELSNELSISNATPPDLSNNQNDKKFEFGATIPENKADVTKQNNNQSHQIGACDGSLSNDNGFLEGDMPHRNKQKGCDNSSNYDDVCDDKEEEDFSMYQSVHIDEKAAVENAGIKNFIDGNDTADGVVMSIQGHKNGNEIEKNEVRFIKLFLGCMSNTIFLCGTLNLISFASLQLRGEERTKGGFITYLIALSLFTISGIIELFMDVLKIRAGRHGRYSNIRCWNILISSFFTIGSMLHIVAFAFWVNHEFTLDSRLFFTSTHLWLVTSCMVVMGEIEGHFRRMSDLQNHNDNANDHEENESFFTTPNLIDTLGNFLFLAATLISCIMQYVDGTEAPFGFLHDAQVVSNLNFSSSPFYVLNALCFVIADIIRLYRVDRKSNENNEQISSERSEDYSNKQSTIDPVDELVNPYLEPIRPHY